MLLVQLGMSYLCRQIPAPSAQPGRYAGANKTARDPAATIQAIVETAKARVIGSCGGGHEHDHCRDQAGSSSVPGPATPPEKHTQQAPMIEVVWSKSIAPLPKWVAAVGTRSASQHQKATGDILTHAERFVPRKEV